MTLSLLDETLESEVRDYCRTWPVTFDTAHGSRLTDVSGRTYLDFFAGAGALNYGHNPSALRDSLIHYLTRDGITHSLDMLTKAKHEFLQTFNELILQPRSLTYKIQFPGPTGTNTVEAALKLARKVTGREQVVSFTNAFHGVTLGALSVTASSQKRRVAGVPLTHVFRVPYDNYVVGAKPGLDYLERMLTDPGSGLTRPAAAIVETVQGEGGVNAASTEWLRSLEELCARNHMLLIVDDVQMGAGRTGPFFSFELAGIRPDIVCLSKSISGFGLPMALTLIKPEYDQWSAGEHNGTFRGNNHAFITATAALEEYWSDRSLEGNTLAKGERVQAALDKLAETVGQVELTPRGRGLARGLHFSRPELAAAACSEAFDRGLLVETAGALNDVLKIMPALTIDTTDLDLGLQVITDSVHAVL